MTNKIIVYYVKGTWSFPSSCPSHKCSWSQCMSSPTVLQFLMFCSSQPLQFDTAVMQPWRLYINWCYGHNLQNAKSLKNRCTHNWGFIKLLTRYAKAWLKNIKKIVKWYHQIIILPASIILILFKKTLKHFSVSNVVMFPKLCFEV